MPATPPRTARASLPGAARGVAALLALLLGYVLIAAIPSPPFTYFALQDRWLAIGFITVLALVSLRLPAFAVPALPWPLTGRAVVVVAIAFALLLWAGTYGVMADYPLTRDEHMVAFDMGVFRRLELATPLAPGWRPFALALVPDFLLDLPGHAALVSSYMPGNAALRTLVATMADPASMNPALAGLGLVALYAVTRRLFPASRSSQAVALLLYLTSTQVIVAAMTSYAMTAHLAFNLVWLALFLRGTRPAHVAALAVGAVATGLHQVIFHPLFVLPFLIDLACRRAWRTLGVYLLGYAAIGLFWLSYPHLVASLSGLGTAVPAGIGTGTGTSTGAAGFLTTRVLPLLLHRDGTGPMLMAINLLRFATWQNIALLPLIAVALPLAWRGEGIARPLCLGLILTVLAMFVLLPYQGHGWGYRYLHPLIGNAVLLAAYGWQRLERQGSDPRAFLATATALTVALAMPFLLWTSHRFVQPYVRADAMIARLPGDIAIIDSETTPFATNLVRNPADLSARPLRLASRALDASALLALCRRGRITFVTPAMMAAEGVGNDHPPRSRHFAALRELAVSRGCRIAG